MNLGISSLGHINQYAKEKEYDTLFDLLYEATRDCLLYVEKQNLNLCEVLLEPLALMKAQEKQEFIELCNSFHSIKKQVHGPFISVSLCSHNKFISDASIESYVLAAEVGEQIGAQNMTIHPGLVSFLPKPLRVFHRERIEAALTKLLKTTKKFDLKICLENMPKGVGICLKPEEIQRFLEHTDIYNLFFTWDTSHSWTNDIEVSKIWKLLHQYIKNIHIVDNFERESDTHPALGTGKIDFREIFSFIQQYDYTGSLILEIGQAKDLDESLDYIQHYLYSPV
ncbi:MAG: sugar phosphate isomerase/epimerase family protein [Promethearchaeia archaeon]